ncbi:MAG: CHAT domain-containing protein [Alphaproteobacteria bacterium]|nr:CHAT domain-containing protein [Alphaproteobacteria bacterium]
MAARYATGNAVMAGLARERQDASDRQTALDKALLAAVAKPPSQRDAGQEQRLRAEIEALGKKIGEIDTRLRREFPRFAELSRPEPLTLADAQSLLGPDEALLVFTVSDSAVFRFAIRRDRAEFRRIGIEKTELDKLVAAVRASVEVAAGQLRRFDVESSHRLYETLVASAAPLLAGASRLMVVPDGPLVGLPFTVLVAAKPPASEGSFASLPQTNLPTRGVRVSEKPLADVRSMADFRQVDWMARHYAISVLPSVGSLKALRVLAQNQTRAPLPFAGFGDPVLRGRPGDKGSQSLTRLAARGTVAEVSLVRELEPLPESAKELEALANALGSKDIFLRQQATERRAKQTDLSKYRVLAFATHAIMAGEFKGYAEPALVLTPPEKGDEIDDGLLSASEVAALKLNADWVVLSACNTAAPDGTPGADGLSGLARAFFYAGSRALLVSHWPVPSEAAVRLTTGAFDVLAKEPGIGRAEALRRSMLAMLDDKALPPEFMHPAVWAPFSLVGEGGAGR